MDYVVGSVAALLSGNVTPNRPKVLKRALTPMKHEPSPNVTPKSELVGDRSIFLSPTMQKKKAIVKKSPKRIFQNPDFDITNDDGNTNISSPKVDKVKKHLTDDLSEDIDISKNLRSPKSPKNKLSKSPEPPSPKKKKIVSTNIEATVSIPASNERKTKKKKKKHGSDSTSTDSSDKNNILIVSNQETGESNTATDTFQTGASKSKRKPSIAHETLTNSESLDTEDNVQKSSGVEKEKKKKKKKPKKSVDDPVQDDPQVESYMGSKANKENEGEIKKKKNKRHKKKSKIAQSKTEIGTDDNIEAEPENTDETEYVNPNAITNRDTDSEHESDDDIESENEENNKAVLDTRPDESSQDEEEETQDTKKGKKILDKEMEKVKHVATEEEVRRTLFVGNVPFSSKCKKEIKKIFSKYGDIETVRIRTVPVKDARVTPKLAVIKNELHPDRSTVNVYIKYKQPSSVNEALVENNTVLNDHHLRVARSDVTGSEHDPKCSIFVGNMPFALEDEGLRAKFEKCGEIESVRIIRDRKTNAGKGFGYVNFTSKDGVELALALTEEDLTIKNRILRVKRCTQPNLTKTHKPQNQFRQQNNQARHNNQGRGYTNQRGMNNRGNYQTNNSGKNQFSNDRFQRRDQQNVDGKSEGAYRRIMNKRKPQENDDGPANKRQKNFNQPNREKKPRKEFVGITAEKKKFQKRKVNKGEKKKKVLSELLTKTRQ